MFSARIAIRLPFKLMGSSSCFSGCLGEERPHQRLKLFASAAGALVVPALSLANGQGQGHFLLAPLAVELIVGHGGPSLLPPDRVLSCWPVSRPPIELYSPTTASARRRCPRRFEPGLRILAENRRAWEPRAAHRRLKYRVTENDRRVGDASQSLAVQEMRDICE